MRKRFVPNDKAYHLFLAAAQDIASFIEPLPETPTEEQESQIVERSSRFNNQFALVLVIAPDDTKEAAIEVVDLVGTTIDTGLLPANFKGP